MEVTQDRVPVAHSKLECLEITEDVQLTLKQFIKKIHKGTCITYNTHRDKELELDTQSL